MALKEFPHMSTFALPAAWWSFVLRGAVAALFGAFTFVRPELTLATFVLLFAWFAFADGALTFAGAARSGRRGESWWSLMLAGVIGLGAGVALFSRPGVAWPPMLALIALWGASTGALGLAAAARLRARIKGEWLLALTGVESLALGAVLGLAPGPNPLKVVFWLGAYAFLFGGTLIAFGLRLRSYGEENEQRTLLAPVVES
jgi:uncharacterized membrane protein HdeD (DUF308 family)